MRPASDFSFIQLSNSRSFTSGSDDESADYIFSVRGRRDARRDCKLKKGFSNHILLCYNPIFDSCIEKKLLYPLCLLGYSDFCRCHGV